jgi:hypothetical protein
MSRGHRHRRRRRWMSSSPSWRHACPSTLRPITTTPSRLHGLLTLWRRSAPPGASCRRPQNCWLGRRLWRSLHRRYVAPPTASIWSPRSYWRSSNADNLEAHSFTAAACAAASTVTCSTTFDPLSSDTLLSRLTRSRRFGTGLLRRHVAIRCALQCDSRAGRGGRRCTQSFTLLGRFPAKYLAGGVGQAVSSSLWDRTRAISSFAASSGHPMSSSIGPTCRASQLPSATERALAF